MNKQQQPWTHHGTMTADAAYRHAQATVNRCLLCRSRKIHRVGCFVPHATALWAAAPTTRPTLWYGLCRRCHVRNQCEGGAPVDAACLAILAQQPGTRH